MADYISRETAIAAFENADADVCEQYPDGYCDYGFGRAAIESILKNVPAANVEPVRHGRWISCSERMPEVETEVLALCNRDGYRFVCPAIYEDGKISEANSIWKWQELWVYGERDEENDCYFIPEGWYENRLFNQDDVCNNVIDCPVTHWMPLPEPPEEGGNGNAADFDVDALWDELTEDLEDGDVLYRIPPSAIDDAPTVDAVLVVRCRECKYYRRYMSGNIYCTHSEGLSSQKPDAFCSYGERREPNEEK